MDNTNAVVETTENGNGSVPSAKEMAEKELFRLLAELGGSRVSDEDIEHRGNKVILPDKMSTGEAIKFLERHRSLQEEETVFSRYFNYRPWDGAVALQRTLKKLFGTAGLPAATYSFFGKNPPEMLTVKIGVDETIEVPWGKLDFPIFGKDACIYSASGKNPELGTIYRIMVSAPRKFGPQIQGLFAAVEKELEENSIYRGKAFDGQDEPDFIDLAAVDPSQAIYAQTTEESLDANIWSLINHTQLMRDLGVPLKRSVLLEGPYGSGKTLAARVTATKAVAANEPWTFIYCRPGRDNLETVMATARLYQPSIVFYEDVDTIASTGEDDPLSRLLDLFDGVQAKGTEIMVIMTTNHVERIHKAMARPGRLDAIIPIGAQDTDGVRRMIEAVVSPQILGELDYNAIGEAMNGFLPAFVKEAIDRTTRYAIARTDGMPKQLETEDFVRAAEGLRPQLELMNRAGEGERLEPLGEALRRTISQVVDGSELTFVGDKDPAAKLRVASNSNGH